MTTQEELVAKLEDLSVLTLNPDGQKRAAAGLISFGVTTWHLELCWQECKRISSSDAFARTAMSQLVQEPKRCSDAATKLAAKFERWKDEQSARSGMQWVTSDNPYGWEKAERAVHSDHGIPGGWNGFRQCFNMTEEERVEAGARDYRRRGCSRVEVLDVFDKARAKRGKDRAPKATWDAVEVEKWKDPIKFDTTERDIYGAPGQQGGAGGAEA